MATVSGEQSAHFLCSICLDLFTDPVTTSCGHNFCKHCITKHWDNNVNYQCPMCKKTFHLRPELLVNTLLSKMVSQFKQEPPREPNTSSSDQQAAKEGEVPCDICTGTKRKALKSCLVCLASYCHPHLEPHLTVSGLKRHQLIPPTENLEHRMCMKHDKPLELFCKTDHTCICLLCPVLDHKDHHIIPLKEVCEEQKTELKKTDVKIQEMIQERRLKIQEIRRSVDLSENAADRETAEGVEVFTALMECVQRRLDQLTDQIQQKHRTAQKQAQDFIQDLEQEITELKNTSAEVTQLQHSEDHLNIVQRAPSIKEIVSVKTWTRVSVPVPSYEGTVVRAVSQLKDDLREHMKEKNVVKAELKAIQRYEVDVTLDPDTAHPRLKLSDNRKKVHHVDEKKNLPEKPQRFSVNPCVLAKQSFSSGRFYFQVQVKRKTKWTLGVARSSVNRKVQISVSPEDGYWTMWLRNGHQYKALGDPPVPLCLESAPETVGVFVDYEEGLVSFYDVDSSVLIYSFTGCHFQDKLLPFFSPCINDEGENSAPLVITPVTHPKSIKTQTSTLQTQTSTHKDPNIHP